MSRFVKWMTLTQEERRQVDPTLVAGAAPGASTGAVKSHSCAVTLPNGITCTVEYIRHQPRAHCFRFLSPIGQQVWCSDQVVGGIPAVEEKAQALAPEAFRLAQQAEQKQAQRKTPPPGQRPVPSAHQIKAASARILAGRYAVCVQFASGNLISIGPTHEQPQAAVEEFQRQDRRLLHGGQTLVIGLFSGWERCWKAAQFVVYPKTREPQTTGEEEAGKVGRNGSEPEQKPTGKRTTSKRRKPQAETG